MPKTEFWSCSPRRHWGISGELHLKNIRQALHLTVQYGSSTSSLHHSFFQSYRIVRHFSKISQNLWLILAIHTHHPLKCTQKNKHQHIYIYIYIYIYILPIPVEKELKKLTCSWVVKSGRRKNQVIINICF